MPIAERVSGPDAFAHLRTTAVAAGLVAAVGFVVIGPAMRLQMFGDGSMFSYAVAMREVWAFHWHNIADRLFVWLYAMLPAEAFVAATGDPQGGIAVYGVLFYAAPLIGLALTYLCDRSPGRLMFAFACAATAALCPPVFGIPTEMWITHALFWPALATAHYARRSPGGAFAVFALIAAMVLSHEGGVVFALAILVTLALRGLQDGTLARATGCVVIAMTIWGIVRVAFPPDAYYASIIDREALLFIDVGNLMSPGFLVPLAAIASYLVFVVIALRFTAKAYLYALAPVGAGLVVYWLWFGHIQNSDERFGLRTVLLIGDPVLAGFAAWYALSAEGRLRLKLPLLPQLLDRLRRPAVVQALAGVIALTLLVHTVEDAKFLSTWSDYKAAVRALAIGSASDPSLGSPRYVSSARINNTLNRLSWFSTTQYLSVLLAPGLKPNRLVVDPGNAYFWLSCETATASEKAKRAFPVESRALVRLYSCQHRK